MTSPQPTSELREAISKILVKWSMPTRQVAISELLAMFESTMLSVIGAHVPGNRAVNQHIDVQRKRLAELTNKENV